MFTVFLIIQIMITVAMVAVILLQRSEGGAALGMGGTGGGMGGLMTGRGAANLLTRTTAILAAGFFAVSIILTVIVRMEGDDTIDFDKVDVPQTDLTVPTTEPEVDDALPVVPDSASSTDEDAAGDITPVIPSEEEEADPVDTDSPVIPDAD